MQKQPCPHQIWKIAIIYFFILSLCCFSTALLADYQRLEIENQTSTTSSDSTPWQVIPPLKAETTTLQEKGFDSTKQLFTSMNRASQINSVAFSADGNTLLSGSSDNTLKLWDRRTGKLLRTLLGHSRSVRSVAFSPDGNTLLSGSDDQTLKLWDRRTGKLLRTLSGHNIRVSSVAFSFDGNTLLSGSWDKTLKLWDQHTGKLLRTLSGHDEVINSIAFSPDGNTLLSGSSDKTLKLWDRRTGKLLHTLSGHSNIVRSVAFSPDGNTLLSGSSDKTLKLWDRRTGKLLQTLSGHSNTVRSVAFSSDGNTLLSGSSDKTLKLWDRRTGKLLQTLSGHNNIVRSVAFSPSGNILLSGSSDNTLKLWDQRTGKLLRTLSGYNESVRSVAFSPDGNTLLSGSFDKTLKLWDQRTGKLLRVLSGHNDGVNSVAFSPDGNTLLSGSSDNTLKLWDQRTGKLWRTLSGHHDGVNSVAFSPDGNTLLSGSSDNTLKLWNRRTGKLLHTLSGHNNGVSSVAFSPDGNTLLSGSFDKTLKLWDQRTGKLLRVLSGHNDGVNSVAFSPDGNTLLSGSSDNTLKLWNWNTGKLLRTLWHNGLVTSVAFSPNGNTLLSGSSDNTLKLWNWNTGKLLRTLSGHNSFVSTVAFSPDGNTLLSGSFDHMIKQWDRQTQKLQKTYWAGNNGTWFRINHHTKNKVLFTLTIADNGTLFPKYMKQNTLVNKKKSSSKDASQLEFETTDIIVTPYKNQIYPIKIHNTGTLPVYWLSLEQSHLELNPKIDKNKQFALLYSTPAEFPLIQANQPWKPNIIQVLEGGQSATLYVNIFASIPYQSTFIEANPKGYNLPISIITANDIKVTKILNVKVKLPKLNFIARENFYNAQTHQLQLTLRNKGEASLNNANFSLQWPNATPAQIKASEVIRPEITAQEKVPLSFALPPNLSQQQREAITLKVTTNDYSSYLWQAKPEVHTLSRYTLLIGLTISLFLLGLSLFFYQRYRIFKHPLVLSLSQTPQELLRLPPKQLSEAKQRLYKAQLLTFVLDKVGISLHSLDQAIVILQSSSAQKKAQYLAAQLGAQLLHEPANRHTTQIQKVANYELKLNNDFGLNLERIRLYFPSADTDPKDVFKQIKTLPNSNRYISLIIGKDSQYQRDLYTETQKISNKWVAPQGAEISELCLSSIADKALMRTLAGQLSLKSISPYQIGGGIKKQGIFFGRTEMIHQIVTNDPANYLVLGGRQMGKSSLLRALQRHYLELSSIDCCYLALSNEVLIPRLIKKLGLKTSDKLESFAHHLEHYLHVREQHMVFLIDEADKFVANEISTDYPVLNVMRRLSEEGHCTFILAGFWQLYQHAVLDYQSPIRNFAETIYVGALEEEACYQLATVPMQNINLRYVDKTLIKTLIKACGQRANLIVQACKYIVVNMLTGQRVIQAEDVQNALYSEEINKELASWVLSDSKIGQYYDKLIVYATINMNDFSSGELIQLLQKKGVSVDVNALDRSLSRLGLVYVLGKDQRSGRYAYHVPLFVEMIQRDDPEIRLQAVLSAGY